MRRGADGTRRATLRLTLGGLALGLMIRLRDGIEVIGEPRAFRPATWPPTAVGAPWSRLE